MPAGPQRFDTLSLASPVNLLYPSRPKGPLAPPRRRRQFSKWARVALIASMLFLLALSSIERVVAQPLSAQLPTDDTTQQHTDTPSTGSDACLHCASGKCDPAGICELVEVGKTCGSASDCASGICGADSLCLAREEFRDNVAEAEMEALKRPEKSFGTHLAEAVSVVVFTFFSTGLLFATFIQIVGTFVFVANFCLPWTAPSPPHLSLSGMKSTFAGWLGGIGRLFSRDRQREAGYDC